MTFVIVAAADFCVDERPLRRGSFRRFPLLLLLPCPRPVIDIAADTEP